MVDSKEARLLEWKAGKTPGPWRVFVFPTYVCNLKCGYCAKALAEDPPELLNELSDERLLHMVDESAELGVREWIIGGGGEPMLRRDLVMRMIERIRGYGMNGVLQTNGTRFRAEHLEQLVKLGWDNVSISIDGPDAESNDFIRHKHSFRQLVGAIRRLNELKDRYSAEKPVVNVACVVTALNYQKLVQLVELCHDLRVYSLTLNDLYVHFEGMDRYILNESQRRELPEICRKALIRARELGLATNIEPFIDTLGCTEDRPLPPPDPSKADDISQVTHALCFEPWLSISIVSSGNAGPCCVFWEGQSDNAKGMSLRDIWFGPYMTEMRRRMLSGDAPGPCVTCQSDMIRQYRDLKGRVNRDPAQFRLSPVHVVRKAVSSVWHHGLSGAYRRGREWLQIRAELRRT